MNLGKLPPSFLHKYSSIDDKPPSPLKIINSRKYCIRTQPGPSNYNIMALFYDYYYWLGKCGCFKNILGSKRLICSCLSLFGHNFDLVEAFATYVFAWTKNIHRMASVIYFMAFVAEIWKQTGINFSHGYYKYKDF